MKYNNSSHKTKYSQPSKKELIKMVNQLRSTLLVVLNSVPSEVVEENGLEISIDSEEVNLARKILSSTNIKP